MNDVMMNLMTGRGEQIIWYLNIILVFVFIFVFGQFFKPNNNV